ncbi:MAG: 6-carboxytetrahydropterin synthase QueD [Saprospirales bacterium]|nr:MAG: 6-carboxytetrahydropterin synthase QueD [Saprospirales bacterium]
MEIFKQFTFDSAHFLPNVPEDHKCRRIHGHTYILEVYIEGPLKEQFEWVEDFAVVKAAVNPVIKELDHYLLNDIPGLENPTCERIAIYIWNRIKPNLPGLKKIRLNETPTSGVVYRGE